MKNKLLNISSKQLLILLMIVLLALVVLSLTLTALNTANVILQVVLIATIFIVLVCFALLHHYIIIPIESLQKYLLGDTSELPNLMALDLNKELSDIVYEVNNLQANLFSQSTQADKQIQSITTNEENADFFSKALIEHVDAIQHACKQIQYQSESKDEQRDDLQKKYKKYQTQLVHLINKQKNNIEFLNETQKILNNSDKIVKKSNKLIDENINQINDVKKVFSEFEHIAERVNELSFKANLLAINTQVETTKLGNKGDAFKEITKEWQQLAAYNVQTSKQCKLFLEGGQSTVSESKTATSNIQKQLVKLNNQLGEGVMNSTTDIAEAGSVLIIVNKVQKEADRLEKTFFKNTSIIQDLPKVFNKVSAIKQTLKAWNNLARSEQEGKS